MFLHMPLCFLYMPLCSYICPYVFISVPKFLHMSLCPYVPPYVPISLHMFLFPYIRMSICHYVCSCFPTYVPMSPHMSLCPYIYSYVPHVSLCLSVPIPRSLFPTACHCIGHVKWWRFCFHTSNVSCSGSRSNSLFPPNHYCRLS